jgi:hypothetical protein
MSIADLIASSKSAVMRKQIDDGRTFMQFSYQNPVTLRQTLNDWAAHGFPAGFVLSTVDVTPPATCVDGVTRNLVDYFQLCAHRSLDQVVSVLQSRLPGMIIGSTVTASSITLTVTKA